MAAKDITYFPLFCSPNGALGYSGSFVYALGFSSGVHTLDAGVRSVYNFGHHVLHHLQSPKVSAKVRRMGRKAVGKPLWGTRIATQILGWQPRCGVLVTSASLRCFYECPQRSLHSRNQRRYRHLRFSPQCWLPQTLATAISGFNTLLIDELP